MTSVSYIYYDFEYRRHPKVTSSILVKGNIFVFNIFFSKFRGVESELEPAKEVIIVEDCKYLSHFHEGEGRIWRDYDPR